MQRLCQDNGTQFVFWKDSCISQPLLDGPDRVQMNGLTDIQQILHK